jgi:hypothetical protein
VLPARPLPAQRLDARFKTNQPQFERLFAIIEDELARNDHAHSKSCTKGLLWLKRCEDAQEAAQLLASCCPRSGHPQLAGSPPAPAPSHHLRISRLLPPPLLSRSGRWSS